MSCALLRGSLVRLLVGDGSGTALQLQTRRQLRSGNPPSSISACAKRRCSLGTSNPQLLPQCTAVGEGRAVHAVHAVQQRSSAIWSAAKSRSSCWEARQA